MNLFDILEGRMQEIFEGGNLAAPIPFKKLAKRASREMRRNAVKADGKVFAPSLFTVQVSPGDDAMIAPLYQQVTDELVDFIAHEAANAGLTMLDEPMVRFIANPDLRAGKVDVIAEVVTSDVLDDLRREEAAYTEARMRMAGARPAGSAEKNVDAQAPGARQPVQAPPVQAQAQAPAPVDAALAADAPVDAFDAPVRPVEAPTGAGARTPKATAEPAPAPVPMPAGQPAQGFYHGLVGGACELTDTASGQRWRIQANSTVIGREESLSDLVLTDTNVSRRHAELRREGSAWALADLGSTNGTRVNGLRIRQPVQLNDGDTIQMGLVALAFREL